jgi:hypothetical protein
VRVALAAIANLLRHGILERLRAIDRILDECCLVFNQTPLFMFVKPLVLLISNIFSRFLCFMVCRSLHQHLAIKEQNGLEMK